MKPLVIYVDDEPHNLTVFEAAMPEDWQILVFDSPLKALDAMTKLNPWVIVSDQRMPGMVGVNFLEIAKKTHPQAKRVLVTGYSEEDLIVDSIRKAGVHEYIRKPWDVDDLCHRITQVVETYRLETDLSQKTSQLESKCKELEQAKQAEETLRKELEAWAPPFILTALQNPDIQFPLTRDLALVTFDIIESSKIHNIEVEGKAVRNLILKEFSEIVIKHGGYRESHSGDSAYAHFGMIEGSARPVESAMAVASEFRTYLRNFGLKYGVVVECGVGLHIAKDAKVHVHKAEFQTPAGRIIQKSFDSTSPDVDLVHRMEKLSHRLPGSNVVMSEQFFKALGNATGGIIDIGEFEMKGQAEPCRIYLKASDRVKAEHLESLKFESTTAETVTSKSAA
jgi:CheY-like chemotaxis protein/class 3 adenylate cyclase